MSVSFLAVFPLSFLAHAPTAWSRSGYRLFCDSGCGVSRTAGYVLLTSGRALLAHKFLDKSLLFLKDIINFYFVYIILFFLLFLRPFSDSLT